MREYLRFYLSTAVGDFDPSHNVTHFCLLSVDFLHPIYKLLPPLLLMIDEGRACHLSQLHDGKSLRATTSGAISNMWPEF